jgi:hypothetical protein
MTRCGSLAIGLTFVAIVGAGHAWAQDCESMTGPARTDCFIGRARILGQQSGIAAGVARKQADEENLRAATGMSVAPKPHRTKPRVSRPGN